MLGKKKRVMCIGTEAQHSRRGRGARLGEKRRSRNELYIFGLGEETKRVTGGEGKGGQMELF